MSLVVLHVDLFLFERFGGLANGKHSRYHESLVSHLNSPTGVAINHRGVLFGLSSLSRGSPHCIMMSVGRNVFLWIWISGSMPYPSAE